MDEFGVLTERFGLKPQGKAAPMASSKRSTNVGSFQTGTFGVNAGLNPKPYNHGSKSTAGNSGLNYDSFHNNHNGTSQSNGKKQTQNFGGLDDGFDILNGINKPASHVSVGNDGMFDYDSVFSGSNKSVSMSSSSQAYVDDIFGGMPGSKIDDGFPAFVSLPEQSVPVDDLLDKINGLGVKSKSTNRKGSEGFAKRAADFEELVPGFGKSSDVDELISGFGKIGSLNNRATTEMNKPRKSTVTPHDDPILIFETTSSTVSSESFQDPLEQFSKFSNAGGTKGNSKNTPSLKSPPKPATRVSTSNKVHDSVVSSIDELEDFAMGRVSNNASKRSNIHTGETAQKSAVNTNRSKEAPNSARVNQSKGMDDLESFFGMGSRSSSVPKSRTTTSDNVFDEQMQQKGKYEVPQRVSYRSSATVNKSSMMTSFDDLSLIFDASDSSVFQEVGGETEERRRARLGRHQRTQQRAARAVADMNQRDLQTKMEQEERRKIAEIVDVEIKRWAAGKEGNMRALLSTLQHVLWPECGWQPVSLTDMITSGSVKKVYRKATLCVHPDKVQQKGASLKQKYTAEKVFDILKEAWNKFSAEELS